MTKEEYNELMDDFRNCVNEGVFEGNRINDIRSKLRKLHKSDNYIIIAKMGGNAFSFLPQSVRFTFSPKVSFEIYFEFERCYPVGIFDRLFEISMHNHCRKIYVMNDLTLREVSECTVNLNVTFEKTSGTIKMEKTKW